MQIVTDHFMSPRSHYINWVKANKADWALLEQNISDTENRNDKREVVDDTDDFV